MKNYMAPMEGVTNWVYRNAYNECFYPMDKYFTPFITAKPNKRLSSKEIKEVSPDTNGKLPVVPQILTNNAEDFVKTAHIFRDEYGHSQLKSWMSFRNRNSQGKRGRIFGRTGKA